MKYLYASLLVFSLVACTVSQKNSSVLPASSPALIPDGKLWASVFQQRAAEYRALCLQAYNIARLRLDEALRNPDGRPMAVVTDIDETVLDNSAYAVQRAQQGLDYDLASWTDWTSRALADTMSGALAFFRYAQSRNVEVFYLTNRKEAERQGTRDNLAKFGFPYADDAHLVLRKDVSSKEPRRREIAAKFNVILLLGDNLADFSDLFDSKPEVRRAVAVQEVSSEFGKRFIMLPNTTYGGWEEAIYNYKYSYTPAQKDSIVRAGLKGY